MTTFIHDTPHQRVVFASGALSRVAEEAARLGFDKSQIDDVAGAAPGFSG